MLKFIYSTVFALTIANSYKLETLGPRPTVFFQDSDAALFSTPVVNPFALLEGITVPAPPDSRDGTIVVVVKNQPVDNSVLLNLGNRQLYIPGIVRVLRNIHAALLVTHGPFLSTDVAEDSSAMQSEYQTVCEAETKDILPASFCVKIISIFRDQFKGTDVFSSKTMPSFVAAVAEQAIPTQYTPLLPIADTYLKIKDWVDLKPIDLQVEAKPQDLETLDSLCSNSFEFSFKNGNMCKTILAIYSKYFVGYDKALGSNLAELNLKKPKWSTHFASLLAKGADGWLTEHMTQSLEAPEDVYTAFTSSLLLSIHVNGFDTSPENAPEYPCGHPEAPSPCQDYSPCGAAEAPNPCIPAPCGHFLAPSPCSPCEEHIVCQHLSHVNRQALLHVNRQALLQHYKSVLKAQLAKKTPPKPVTKKPTATPTEHPTEAVIPPTEKPTTPRPTSKPTPVPTNTPTTKPTLTPTALPTLPPTHLNATAALCASFKQGCPCGHPLAPPVCVPCNLHPLGCPCGHPIVPSPCQPCEQHILGCGAAHLPTTCPCASLVLTSTQSCPCATNTVAANMPPAGSVAYVSLLKGAHIAAKSACAAVLKAGGTVAASNAAAVAAHASHIAAHATAAVAAHAAGAAVLKAGGTIAQANAATHAHFTAHLTQHAASMAQLHGVGSPEHKAAVEALANQKVGFFPNQISQINHFDTWVDTATPCLISPPLCHNGKCVDKRAKHYVCVCDHGWAGNNCEIPLTAQVYGQITQLAFNLPFFSFNVPFAAVSNDHLDSAIFEAQIKRDLSVALNTEASRFIVKGLSPSGDNKYTVVTINIAPPTRAGDITTADINDKMKEWMFPSLAPELSSGIATRHLFVPGSANAQPRFQSKHALPRAPELSPMPTKLAADIQKNGTTGAIVSMVVLCLPILLVFAL